MSAIEKREGVFCESSAGPRGLVLQRPHLEAERRYRIEPAIEGFRRTSERGFSWNMVWQAGQPAPRDLTRSSNSPPTAQPGGTDRVPG